MLKRRHQIEYLGVNASRCFAWLIGHYTIINEDDHRDVGNFRETTSRDMMGPALIQTLPITGKVHSTRVIGTIRQHAEEIDPHAQDNHHDENEAS